MAQKIQIVPNLHTAGGEFKYTDSGEEFSGAFHYRIDDDTYFTHATPEIGLESSRQISLIDPRFRDRDGYMVTPYNVKKDYLLKLGKKTYQDVKDVIDNEIKEFKPEEALPSDLTLEERIFLMLQEFQDLKDDMTDPDLRNLIRDAISETTLTDTGFTDPLRLDYFDIAHIGFLLKATLHDNIGPHIEIRVNGNLVFDDFINHTEFKWYNFQVPIRAELEQQLVEVKFDNDATGPDGDRNLTIGRLKNKQIASHLILSDEDQAVVVNNDNNPILDSEHENIFNVMHSDGPQLKDYWNAFVPNTTIYIYDVTGTTLPNYYQSNSASYPGMFLGFQNWDSCVKFELPNDWFLSELPPVPVEFDEEDFMIENVRNTKINLAEADMKADIRDAQTEALADKLTQERDDMEVLKIEAESKRDSLEGQIDGMKASIRKMSDEWVKQTTFRNFRLWDTETLTNSENTNIWRQWNNGNVYSGAVRPKHFTEGNYALKERMTCYLTGNKPPVSLIGLSNTKHSIRMVYNLNQEPGDAEGWYQAPQTIGFLIKGTPDGSGIQPHWKIKWHPRPSRNIKDLTVIQEGDITWSSNEYQWVYATLNNYMMGENTGKGRIAIEFSQNQTTGGGDRDMWVKAMKDDFGNVYYIDGTTTSKNADETNNVQSNSDSVPGLSGGTVKLYQKDSNSYNTDYKYGTGYKASSTSNTAYTFGTAFNGKFAGRMDVASMIVVEVEHNDATFWSTEVSSNPWAGISMNRTEGSTQSKLYLYPHQRYKLTFCSRNPHNPAQAPEFDGGNHKCRIFIGDTRNGWVGTPRPWPGSNGYEWYASSFFDNDAGGAWTKHEMEFTPIPGPQDGSTRAWLYMYAHQGIVNEVHVTDYAEFKLEAVDSTDI